MSRLDTAIILLCPCCCPAAVCRRSLLEVGGDGAPAGNYGYTNSGYSVYEEENERLTESLRTKVSAIKSLSIEIGTEVKNQNKMLSEMVVFVFFKCRITILTLRVDF